MGGFSETGSGSRSASRATPAPRNAAAFAPGQTGRAWTIPFPGDVLTGETFVQTNQIGMFRLFFTLFSVKLV